MQRNNNFLSVGDTHSNGTDHKEALANFSSKYGVVFRNISKQNGNLEPDKKENSDNVANMQTRTDSTRPALERFRQAGLKARFVQQIEKIVDDRMTVKQIFSRYVENSTLHGFRFIFMKTFVLRRVLWTILTVTMAAIFLSELKNSIVLYLEYPFTTTSTMEYMHTLNFPAISICNLNSLEEPRVNSNYTQHIYERALLPVQYHNRTIAHDMSGMELRKILKESSPGINDIFQGCEWKSRDTAKTGTPNLCFGRNFTSYVDLHGQTCYTFNGENSLNRLTLNETGLNMALKLEFDLKVKKSLPLQEIGLKIIVHDQSETPLHQAGFVVSPGFQSLVELNVRKTKNLPGPYATRCGERLLTFYEKYHQSKCFLEKLTEEIQKKCKCNGLFMDEVTLDADYPACSLNQTVDCLLPIVDRFDRKTNTDCPVDCETIKYGTSLSYARFIPNTSFKSTLLDDGRRSYIQRLQKKMTGKDLERYIEENVLVVYFFYQEMKEEKVGQEKSYDHFKLIGDVGGQLGLLLGASVLTLVEFVDLFFFTLYHQLLRLYRRKKNVKCEIS